nr:rifin PIR protein,putative [Plasmodium sp. DRC-Itaito]
MKVNTHKKPSITQHTPKIPTTRLLCECELYEPANYDNDPQMKEVMQQFEDRTTQRFHEYDDRMKEKRRQCKEQCDKEIQKIILKDKLEKQMAQQFATLDTDIQSDAIPTCVCEKSIADKVEKGCLRCGGILGTAVPELGSIGGTALYVLNTWKTGALLAATEEAIAEGIAAGIEAGNAAGAAKVVKLVELQFNITTLSGKTLESVFTTKNYTVTPTITHYIHSEFKKTCLTSGSSDKLLCSFGYNKATSKVESDFAYKSIEASAKNIVTQAQGAAEATKTEVTSATTAQITTEKTGEIAATYGAWKTTITASIIALVVIVLIMIIIYLILRYRRKKKMKKKLQYIKLLEE